MFRNMNVHSLWTDRRGSVAVEFAIISVVLITFMFFLADLVLRQATVGKLDRTTYSIAGVLRERIQLYDSNETLSQDDGTQIYRLAKRMLQDMNPGGNMAPLKIRIEQLFFAPRIDLTDNRKQPLEGITWMYNIHGDECQPARPLSELQDLSPRGSYGRWVPLYQVTLCLPTTSWYRRLFQESESHPTLSSSSIVMAR